MSFTSVGPSTRDVRASLAQYLAERLLAVPYAVYWHAANALQSDATTWWGNYREQQATHLASSTLQQHLSAASGVFALVEPTDGAKEWLVQGTTDGKVPGLNYLPVPSCVVDVLPVQTHRAYELGSNVHWRERDLDLAAVVRSPLEQDLLSDAFVAWFPVGAHFTVRNYATGDGTTVLGTLRLAAVSIAVADAWDDASTQTWHVLASMVGEFVA